jgi:hypothetical protein
VPLNESLLMFSLAFTIINYGRQPSGTLWLRLGGENSSPAIAADESLINFNGDSLGCFGKLYKHSRHEARELQINIYENSSHWREFFGRERRKKKKFTILVSISMSMFPLIRRRT